MLVALIVLLLGGAVVSALAVGSDDGDTGVDLGAGVTTTTTAVPATTTTTAVPATTTTTTAPGTGSTSRSDPASGLAAGGTAEGTTNNPETGGEDLLLPGLTLLGAGAAMRRFRRR